jgi:hypothetical protein
MLRKADAFHDRYPTLYVAAAFVFLIVVLSATAVFLVARTFLVVEAFLALPHSPDSVFVQPRWQSYFPHFV